ncbi:MAG: DUF262 domain-containing protein [Armatimonadetes bacterium]|nr:DUF262 domain-containing protein [Armatimonadota bacterium]
MRKRRQNFERVAWFNDLYTRGLLDLDPPYQRRSVWNQQYKDDFIDTILLDYPAPSIFLYEEVDDDTGKTKYAVVDGKQRLTTVFEFIANQFPISEKSLIESLRGKFFQQLDAKNKPKVWLYDFCVEYLPTNDASIIGAIFDRINRNVAKLTSQELRHARFDGLFIERCEKLAEWTLEQLQGIPRFTPAALRQMKDVEFVANLLLLIELGPRGWSRYELDTAFTERDVDWSVEEEVVASYSRAISTIKSLFTKTQGKLLRDSRLKNQADFYSLVGAVNQNISFCTMKPNTVVKRLASFINVVDNQEKRTDDPQASLYYDMARSASNDSGPRKERVMILSEVIVGSWIPNE